MNLYTWVSQQTGLSPLVLAGIGGAESLISVQAHTDGSQFFSKWNLSNLAQPTAEQIAAILAMPEPVNTKVIKETCSKFIFDVAPATAQANASAFMLGGTATATQTAGFQALQAWIKACRTQCKTLIANNDSDYDNQRAKYPIATQDVLDFLKSI